MIKYVAFLLLLAFQSAGQVMEKKGISQVLSHGLPPLSLDFARHAASNIYVVSGVICAGIGFALWLYLLSQFQLNYIYPLSSILYILITVLSYVILNEPITGTKIAGILVITAGCFLINVK